MEDVWEDFESGEGFKPNAVKMRCLAADFEDQRYDDDGYETATSVEQWEVEDSVKRCIEVLRHTLDMDPMAPILQKDAHVQFLKKGLHYLPSSLEVLDSSRSWLCYWILHSIEILNEPIPEETKSQVIEFLKLCQDENGGFAGGPGQEPHLAPTYAAVNALCILKCKAAYDVIDRAKLLNFLFRLKKRDGSFRMHEGSESDIRGVYCALSVAMMTSIWSQELTKNTAHWVSRCQTYEGGFGGVPDMEAHGGYTFCGLASLVLLKEGKLINVHKLLRWLVNRQMRYEGGFQGRTNKLVDSCYSFWQGGSFPLVHRLLNKTDPENMDMSCWLFNQKALQEYLLISCQAPHGGLIDKPGKTRDYYHTCYALSGLSVAQHFHNGIKGYETVIGHYNNELIPTHPIYNICVPTAIQAIQYFQQLTYPVMPDECEISDSGDEMEL
ncbi:protein farnesyltransferase subunit beta-like [Argiope bruennichi]|uniref:Protein farnesyltransferase subunit beta n=1 Tax=Argiope bruennichi TaxID=94029 RepID=A0A8T0EV79_ARGBR|nr:protein farnesyltransferase subunit beta-like [Argiope bruennichi]KAF8781651.1 Protein farnesyltransferase subunit beta like protein [Argiope bruennichi]